MGIFDGQDRLDSTQSKDENAHLERVANQQWQQPQGPYGQQGQGYDPGPGGYHPVPKRGNSGADYGQGGPTTQYQQRPGDWQNAPPSQRYPINPIGGGRPGYGVSGTIPTPDGGVTTPQVQQPGQGPFVPQNPGQNAPIDQNNNPYIVGGGGQYVPQQIPQQVPQQYPLPQQPGRPGDTAPRPAADTSPLNGEQLLDWAAQGGGSYLAHKRYLSNMPDIGYPSLATQNKLAKPMNDYLTKSESYQGVLSERLKPLSTQLEDIGKEHGISASASKLVNNPTLESSLSTTEAKTLASYRQVSGELTAVERYHGLIDKGLADIKIMPPKPTLEAAEFTGVSRTIAGNFGTSSEALGTELKAALVKQEAAAGQARFGNMATLGLGLLANYAIDRHWYAGDKPSLRTDIVDGALPFIALIPRGNMLMKVGAMALIHGIFKGLDHQDMQKHPSDR